MPCEAGKVPVPRPHGSRQAGLPFPGPAHRHRFFPWLCTSEGTLSPLSRLGCVSRSQTSLPPYWLECVPSDGCRSCSCPVLGAALRGCSPLVPAVHCLVAGS